MYQHEIKRGETLYKIARNYSININDIIKANPNKNHLRTGEVINIPQINMSGKALPLHDEWRSLWEQHVAWTRMVISGDVFNSPDLQYAINRLLRNPADMAAVIRTYYGESNANYFQMLIHDHLQIALDLVNAAKAGESEATAKLETRWYANADQIAHILSILNPYWREQVFKSMLHEHLALTKNEAVAIMNKNYPESIRLYDNIEQQALAMADAFANGIVRQFNI